MTLILLTGILLLAVSIGLGSSFIDKIRDKSALIQKLRNVSWFKSHWRTGFFLFFMNAVLFTFTGLFLYIVTLVHIPFIYLIGPVLGVIMSILLWIIIRKEWQGTKVDRLKMGLTGSGFYAMLALLFIFWLASIKPSFPGEDMMMHAMGLLMGSVVTIVAFVICFGITGFTQGDKEQ